MSFVEALGLVIQILLFAVFLATVVERLVEQFINPPLKRLGWEAYTPYPALALGCLISVLFNIDLFTPVAEAIGLQPLTNWAGLVLTGLLVGAGSDVLHQVWPAKAGGPAKG